ncbi:MAG: hypothetical protein AAF770_03635 [Bacteroidota bacterium]
MRLSSYFNRLAVKKRKIVVLVPILHLLVYIFPNPLSLAKEATNYQENIIKKSYPMQNNHQSFLTLPTKQAIKILIITIVIFIVTAGIVFYGYKQDQLNQTESQSSKAIKAFVDEHRSSQKVFPYLTQFIDLPIDDPLMIQKTDFANFSSKNQPYTYGHSLYEWHFLPADKLKEAHAKGHAAIVAFKWGETIVQYPDGSMKKLAQSVEKGDCWLLPNALGTLNYKEMGYKQGKRVSHRHLRSKDSGTGVLPYNIDALLQKAGNRQDLYILISQGMTVYLDVADSTVTYLQQLQQAGKIKGFFILDSAKVPYVLLNLILKGLQVAVLYHSTC